ncbi:hypothetical protein [Hydrocarboniphaga sp.]|uniref:hypothetical protein n=1 Tax=Hydrocarboniphaga sp. TaxID=2033016 RepID=UPI003D0FC053
MQGQPQRQRGLALFDVLIALLVLALGVPALCRLQALVLLEGSNARARAAAAQLAREKLDDLRQFTQLPAAGGGTYGFDECGDDRGGRENADGSLMVAAGDIALSDFRYQRHWSVSGYSWCDAAALTPGVCSGSARAALLQIRVTLSWTQVDGSAAELSLDGAIAAIDPLLAGGALIRRPSLLPPAPLPL